MGHLCHLLREAGKLMLLKSKSQNDVGSHFLFCPDAYRPTGVLKQVAVGDQILRSDDALVPPPQASVGGGGGFFEAAGGGGGDDEEDDQEGHAKYVLEDILDKAFSGLFNPQLA